jgi:hypothetical protein
MAKAFLFGILKKSSPPPIRKQFENFQWQSVANMSATINKPKAVFVIPHEAYEILKQNNMHITINESTPLSRAKLIESVKGCDAIFCTLNEKIDKEILDSAGEQLKV